MMNTLSRYREQGRFQLHGFVILPDHIHVLITPAHNHSIERCVQLIKGGFSFAVRNDLTGEVWQDGYHTHRITDARDYNNQLLYIANNPKRKNIQDHPHVHLHHAHLLDPTPKHLSGF